MRTLCAVLICFGLAACSRDVNPSGDGDVTVPDAVDAVTRDVFVSDALEASVPDVQDVTIDTGPASGDLIALSAGGGRDIAALADGTAFIAGNTAGEPASLSRYRPDGTLAWRRDAMGSGTRNALSVASLPDGSTWITGWYRGTLRLGAGEPHDTTLPASSGAGDSAFVARFAGDGTLVWARAITGQDYATGSAVAAMPDGTVYVTGTFQSHAVFGAGEPGETTLSTAGLDDVFVARFSPDGNVMWARSAGSDIGDVARDIAVAADGSLAVAGSFGSRSITFGRGEPTETVLTSAGLGDLFVARFESDGAFTWARSAGGLTNDHASGVAIAPDGTVLVSGVYSGAATFGAGTATQTVVNSEGSGLFVARYDHAGAFVWVRDGRGGPYGPGASGNDAYSVAVGADGSVFLAGRIEYDVTFAPDTPGAITVHSAGAHDIAVARYDSDGTLRWVRRAGGASEDTAYALALAGEATVLVTGVAGPAAVFGPGESRETTIADGGGFVMRLRP